MTFGYRGSQFGEDGGPLELAYALTVHKAQGSDFGVVFFVLPKTRLLSRELLYTGLTRSKQKLVLLVEGEDASALYDLTLPTRSETARRNTNLFRSVVREDADKAPYAEHLIHRLSDGRMVRSESELAIAIELQRLGMWDRCYYERHSTEPVPGRLRPDFTFIDAGGDPIIWEHLGMLDSESYRGAWEWKLEWYHQNRLPRREPVHDRGRRLRRTRSGRADAGSPGDRGAPIAPYQTQTLYDRLGALLAAGQAAISASRIVMKAAYWQFVGATGRQLAEEPRRSVPRRHARPGWPGGRLSAWRGVPSPSLTARD